jgi:antitoxin component YwqK of YwqJK toxin-antitoxin module
MAADIMARRAPLRSNVCWGVLFLLAACGNHKRAQEQAQYVNAADARLSQVNGTIQYQQQPFTGILFSLFSNSDTAIAQGYRNGQAHGAWRQYYEKGRVKQERFFEDGSKEGRFTAYWPNGQKQLDYHFKNNEYEGFCREWNAAGVLIKEMHYVAGYEDGSQKLFYDNGKVRSNYVILNGKRYGLLGTKNCINVSDSILKK